MNTERQHAGHSQPQEIAPEVREMADRVSQAQERRMRLSVESYDKTVSELRDKGRAEIRRIVGPKTWPALRHVMRRERLTLRERMQPPEGPFRDLEAEVLARKVAVVRFLDEEGVSPDRVMAVVQDYNRQIRDLPLTPATARRGVPLA